MRQLTPAIRNERPVYCKNEHRVSFGSSPGGVWIVKEKGSKYVEPEAESLEKFLASGFLIAPCKAHPCT